MQETIAQIHHYYSLWQETDTAEHTGKGCSKRTKAMVKQRKLQQRTERPEYSQNKNSCSCLFLKRDATKPTAFLFSSTKI